MKGMETVMGEGSSCGSRQLSDVLHLGYASWIGRYAQSDCVLVEILYECGAVPFVRTNVPQTLMVKRFFRKHDRVNASISGGRP